MHRQGVHLFAKQGAGLPGVIGGVFHHLDLDELPGFQGVPGLLDEVGADAFLADVHDGRLVVGKGAQIGALFRAKFHLHAGILLHTAPHWR